MKTSLVTGGAGFIGSHLVDFLVQNGEKVIVLDKMTYAADKSNLDSAFSSGNVTLIEGDIQNSVLVLELLNKHNIQTVYHLAAESHVDNSINDASPFIMTNIVGTYALLQAALTYWQEQNKPKEFRFIHVSTDEVYGQLTDGEEAFNENTPYRPSSPYSASKAASDHLARAWYHTYKLPVIVTNCSNNYGPRQHEEKLIPTVIRNALAGKPIPIYGTGKNIRDWLNVKDHAKGIYLAASRGRIGDSYCFGGGNELQNVELAKELCRELDKIRPLQNGKHYEEKIVFVQDRKGHDWRYAINFDYASKKLGYAPEVDFKNGLIETIESYLS